MSNLILRSLVIENFKSYYGKHTFELDREPGLYYISGRNLIEPELGANGVGKTGIWDALTWVLWGKTGRDNRPADAILPWEKPDTTCSVSLKFTRLNRTQTLTRTRHPNDLRLAYKDKERTIDQDEVEALLGISEELFRRSIVLGQFGALFLDLRAEQQSQLFNDALSLDLWLKAAGRASQQHKSVTSKLAELKIEEARAEGRIKELADQLKMETTLQKDYEKALDKRRKDVKSQIADTEREISSQASTEAPGRAKVSDVSQAVEKALADLERTRRDCNRDLADARAGSAALAPQQAEHRTLIASYRRSIEGDRTCPTCGQEAPLAHLKEKLAKAERRKQLLASQAATFEDTISRLETKVAKLDSEIETMRDKQRQMLRLTTELDSLQREFKKLDTVNPHDATVHNLSARLKDTKANRVVTVNKIEKTEKAIGVCAYWMDAFKEIRLSIIDQVLTELEITTTQHAASLGLDDWLIKFDTEKITQKGNISTVFSVLLYPPEQDDPVKFESYSGGESQRLQLAVSFGLAEVLLTRSGVEPNIQVLDEPTKGLSPEGIDNLLECLSARAKDLDQAIYITEHHSLEKGFFNETIIIEKTADGSRIA